MMGFSPYVTQEYIFVPYVQHIFLRDSVLLHCYHSKVSINAFQCEVTYAWHIEFTL